jgi:hypothetical protein
LISRRTATAIGKAYEQAYTYWNRPSGRISSGYTTFYGEALYEFLFDNDFQAWFCNAAKGIKAAKVKEFMMKLHTGETLAAATTNWSWEQRQRLGQRYLFDLAEAALKDHSQSDAWKRDRCKQPMEDLVRSLELDGYRFESGRLLVPESDVLDVKEASGVLESIYMEVNLANRDVAFHCLKLSEEHWFGEKWDDCISNARRFLECVLQGVAAAHSIRSTATPLSERVYDRPVEVREYLEREGLLETKEKKALAEVYGLLSNVGSHPYIAEKDQARLLRQQALLLSQFVMLRYQGFLRAAR